MSSSKYTPTTTTTKIAKKPTEHSTTSSSPTDSKYSIKSIFFGGAAGAISKCTIAPLERLRLLKQTGGSTTSTFQTMWIVARNEGVSGFWRGNFINVVRIFPSRGILFAANDFYRDYVFSWMDTPTTADGKTWHPLWSMVSSGGLAGMTAVVGTYPLDVVRTRLAGHIHYDTSTTYVERSMTRLLYQMAREEGIRSWFRGIGPTLAGAMPYEGLKFGVYGILTETVIPAIKTENTDTVFLNLFSGALAGCTAGLVMFPNDTVRKLMQMDGYHAAPGIDGNTRPYSSAWDVWVRVYKQHGIRRFYRGLVPYMLRLVPGTAIQFGAYNELQKKSRKE
jgi:hypothetical protein